MASNPTNGRALRIGDADRDAAMKKLRDHMVAGRLSLDEFDDRVGKALAAKTAADLEPLFADLPRDPDAVDGVSVWRAPVPVAKQHTPFHTAQRWMIVLSPVLLLLLFTGWSRWWLAFVVWFVVAAVLSRADKAMLDSRKERRELGR
jgi:hypothetical protein